MGFWDSTKKFLSEASANMEATQEAERLLALGETVAYRQLKVSSRNGVDRDKQRRLIDAFDRISRSESGEKATLAAKLADYAEGL